MRSRWYDPRDGRFLNEDTFEGQINNPLSLNLYTYVQNNPLTNVDPSGHCPLFACSEKALNKEVEIADNFCTWFGCDTFLSGLMGLGPEFVILSEPKAVMTTVEEAPGFLKGLWNNVKGWFSKSPKDASHAVGNAEQAQNILNGINPELFNPKSRFGGGFYLAQNGDTAVAEVGMHGKDAKYIVRYQVDFNGQKVLDLTNSKVAKQWNFDINAISSTHQAIGAKARAEGYSAIIAPSLREAGSNYVILDNFNEILIPQMVIPIK